MIYSYGLLIFRTEFSLLRIDFTKFLNKMAFFLAQIREQL